MRFKDRINIQGYEALSRRKYGWRHHIAHYNRGRGARIYLCGCGKSIKVGNEFLRTGKLIKRTNFQRRSKY